MSARPRRSRIAWPGPTNIAGVEPGHSHELPRGFRIIVKAQTLAIVALLVAVGVLSYFVWTQQEYIEGKGEQRDRENVELERRIDDAICDLLSLAPADSAQADYYREQLGCTHPGIPTDQLPPEIRQRFEPTPAPNPPAAATQEPPAMGSGAVPNPQRPTPDYTPVPPGTTPTTERPPEPEPDPVVDVSPLTDVVCDLIGVCA